AIPVLWLSGPSGVGKSSVGWELFTHWTGKGIKTAFVDSDQISLCHPTPESVTHHIGAQNLAAIWPNLRREGMRCMILAGIADTAEQVRQYTDRVPDAAWTLCRLRAGSAELRQRFLVRGWRLDLVDAALARAEALDRADFTDMCVDTGGLTVPEVARLIRERAGGWPGTILPGVLPLPLPAVRVSEEGDRIPLLWFSGATAVGKSTVAYEVFRRIVRSGVRAAYVDVKQIGALRPAPTVLKARNLAALWAGYRAAGARYLIVSGEADSDDSVRRYTGLLPGTTPTVIRLHAEAATLAERVALRGRGEGPAIPGDELKGLPAAGLQQAAGRAAHEAEVLDAAGAGDLRITTDGRPAQEVAAEIWCQFPRGTTRPDS
ncbi:hypothetical protein, partial [Sinosporangium siamense]